MYISNSANAKLHFSLNKRNEILDRGIDIKYLSVNWITLMIDDSTKLDKLNGKDIFGC